MVSGPVSVSSPSNPNSAISISGNGNAQLVWSVWQGGCPPVRDTIVIIAYDNPTTANAGLDIPVCLSAGSTTLSGNIPSIGTGAWSLVSGSVNIQSPTLNNSGVNSLSPGTHMLQWGITNGVCPVSTDLMGIIVDDVAALPKARELAFAISNRIVVSLH